MGAVAALVAGVLALSAVPSYGGANVMELKGVSRHASGPFEGNNAFSGKWAGGVTLASFCSATRFGELSPGSDTGSARLRLNGDECSV